MNAHIRIPRGLEVKGLDDGDDDTGTKLLERFDELCTRSEKSFETVGSKLEGLKKELAAEKKEREALELRMSRPGANAAGKSTLALEAERKAIGAFMRTGDEAEMKGLTVGSDPAAGYLVLPEVSLTLQQKIHDLSPIRQIARVETMGMGSGDAWEEPYDMSEIGATWVGESTARTETTNPAIKMLRVPLKEIYAHITASQRLLDDSQYDIGGWLEGRMADKFARSEGTAFVAGTNTTDPEGFTTGATPVTTGDATRTFGVLQYVASGAAATLSTSTPADVFKDIYWTLRAPYRQNSTWVMNSATANVVDKLKDGMGQYLWRNGMLAGSPDSLLNRPVMIAEDMPSIGAGNFPVAFGDYKKGYLIVDRPGLKMLRDPYTNKPHVIFYAYRRTGGAIANSEAIKLLKIAAS